MTRRKEIAAVLALAAFLDGTLASVAPRVALAQVARDSAEALLAAGVVAYDDLDYPNAIALLEQALAKGLSKEAQLKAYDYIAFSSVGEGQEAAAEEAFRKVLAIDASHKLAESVSPRIQAVFDRAKTAAAPAPPVPSAPAAAKTDVVLYPLVEPPEGTAGSPLTVSVSSHDPAGRVASLWIFHRARGASAYAKLEAPHSGVGAFAGTVPGAQVARPALQYYLEGRDDADALVASRGSAEEPLEVPVKAPPKKPVYATWWFWTIMGGVVVGAATVGGVLGSRGGSSDAAMVTIVPR
jgi:hypothetical protein